MSPLAGARPWTEIATWGRMVKFSHSIFALPFALSGAVLAAAESGIESVQVAWIVVAMIAARNAAMGFNRLVDQHLDGANPRTSERELPRGRLSRASVWIFTVALAGLFVFASFMLGPLCGWLSPLALLIVFGYSYSKRFTWASHLWLGLALAVAPVGGWVAVHGSFSLTAWLLGLAVLFWVAGFDVIYACQDIDFDRQAGLHSIPARFGARRALTLARALHAMALATLAVIGVTASMHPVYWGGLALIGAILIWEHRLVSHEDLSRIGMAFFNMNGVISVLYLAVILISLAASSGRLGF